MRLTSSCNAPNRRRKSAERAPVPEQERGGGREPQYEDERRHQKIVPAKISPERVEKCEHIDDRKLRLRVPSRARRA